MTNEIKYCLIGAIITGIITGALIYFDVTGILIVLTKIVYIGFTLGLLYFVIRLLSTAETAKEGS